MQLAKMPAVTAGVLALSLAAWGCATKKHVREAIAPVQKQVNDVQQMSQGNKQAIGDLDRQVSVADEKATDAGKKASDAYTAANRANDAATQAGQRADGARSLAEQTQASLRGLVDNLDNYKLVDTKKVYFRFGKSDLSPNETATLDGAIQAIGQTKNVVIEVEGYTDRVGAKNYNLALSQKRADAVVRYLTEHDVPLRRIHQLGVGEMQDEGRRANKENRRVDVRIFALDASVASLQSSGQAAPPPAAQ